MIEQKDIERKVRALLKKAEGTQFEAEADAFLRKAQELMLRYGIDEERLWASDPSRRAKIEQREIKIEDRKQGSDDKRRILHMIAVNNHCRSYYKPGYGKTVIVGYPNDILFVEMLYTSIVSQMGFKLAMALAHHGEHEHPKVFRNNFYQAFSSRICERLAVNATEARKTLISEDPSTAIAIRERGEQVEDWMRENLHLRAGRAKANSGRYSSNARAAGHVAANSTDISGGRGGKIGSGRKALNQ